MLQTITYFPAFLLQTITYFSCYIVLYITFSYNPYKNMICLQPLLAILLHHQNEIKSFIKVMGKIKISEKKGNVIHGVLLIALFSMSAFYIAQFQWVKNLSLSPLIVGIILGMIYANSLRNFIPDTWVPGIKFCTKRILRVGIILYGFRLTLQQVFDVGMSAFVVDCIIICGTIFLGILFGKLYKMDSDTALMTSTGSAICGAAAVLGAEPVVKCEAHTTAVAVSTVVIFGTLSMFLYPIAYRSGILSLSPEQMAIYTGSTLHEVAHVVGAGNAMDATGALHIADQATITKMIRVMLLAPVLVIMSIALARVRSRKNATGKSKGKITVPWFAFGFLGIIILNSLLGACSFIPADGLKSCTDAINSFDTFLLTMAMTALGTETSFDKFRQAGAKPFYLAGTLYVWLIVGGYFFVKILA
jgi:uncharacterized integral membrane protein (TIGR00698 family)